MSIWNWTIRLQQNDLDNIESFIQKKATEFQIIASISFKTTNSSKNNFFQN